MRISILSRNNNDNYKKEYLKMMKILTSKCVTVHDKKETYFDFINKYLFHNWKYRGTYLDVYEYLNSIGIHLSNKKITFNNLLNLIEFLLNMQQLIESSKYYSKNTIYSVKCSSILFHNIPLILEEYEYEAYSVDDKVYLLQGLSDYDDVLELISDDLKELIVLYRSSLSTGLKIKRMILEKIYLILVENDYKKYNVSLFSTIKLIITKMGVIGNIDKKYQHLSTYKLKKYYDYCYECILYLLKTENINRYKEEIKQITKE